MALYHSAKGSVDYEVVGNPTITDGIASGFSSGDYLETNNNVSAHTTQEWNVTFTVGSDRWDDQDIMTSPHNLRIMLSSAKIRVAVGDNESYISTETVQANTTYVVNIQTSNNSIVIKYKEYASSSFVEIYNGVSAVSFGTINPCRFGVYSYTYPHQFKGSIDLNETYIKVNGQPWFGVSPIELQKHQLKGPVGYEVVGSPTIVDGVASGFSSSNYLSLPSTLDLSQNWEIETEFTTGNDVSAEQFVFTDTKGIFPIGFGIFTDSKFIIYFLNSEANRVYYKSGTAIENTKYKIKINYSNGSLNLYINDVLKMTRESNYPSSYVNRQIIFGEGRPANKPFNGSIDLNETYIKVNGKLWYYQPAPTKYIVKDNSLVFASQDLYLTGPVNYTKVGNPTITDGVVSGFSSSNYLKLPTITNDFIKKLNQSSEIGIKLTTPTEEISQYAIQAFFIPYSGTSSGFSFYKDGKKIRWTITPGYYIDTPSFNDGETVRLKGIRNNGTAELLYSTNGTSYTSAGTLDISNIEDPSASGNNAIPKVGINGNTASGWQYTGSIDLNETYIKVNGSLWFYGKNYASANIAPVPANYTYGTTTTSAIGYVDMRTQAFTAAPQGATIGRDE